MGNGLGPRAGQRWPIFPKHVLFVMSPPETPPPKQKLFFSILTTRLAESVEGLNSSIAWRVIGLQSSTRKMAHAGLKGLNFVAVHFV